LKSRKREEIKIQLEKYQLAKSACLCIKDLTDFLKINFLFFKNFEEPLQASPAKIS